MNVERFDYSSTTGLFSLDTMIQQLNDYNFLIKHLCIQNFNVIDKAEEKIKDEINQSIEKITIKTYD